MYYSNCYNFIRINLYEIIKSKKSRSKYIPLQTNITDSIETELMEYIS